MTMLENGITSAILLAAGASRRMGENKLLIPMHDTTPLKLCFDALVSSNVQRIIITISDLTCEYAKQLSSTTAKEVVLVEGGATRAKSVAAALTKCGYDTDVVVIHDAARCLVTPSTVNTSIALAKKHGSAIATAAISDTLRQVNDNVVIDRESVLAMQTPQTFSFRRIKWAYDRAEQFVGIMPTDDCEMYIHAGFQPYYFECETLNNKLTRPQDVELFEAIISARHTNSAV